ncbi:MAG: T9SS type A sorting domain-containing protein [Lewinellaceae bacterium]|nr:T9SS type A sorting domain-containing protein [Saprospiraceae bacterium]MCB9316418.1 T9SS type A sorting domain-containing protein [Lewinellaceae bacterium]MCB9330303.1 T9SS type A sorting domain-containing protein [Lewinellaceae bacterium]
MKQLLTKSLPLLAFLLCGMSAQAQNVFWSEDFTGGIPAGWTNVDASGQGFVWEYCANTDPGCAPVFTGEQAFQATTASTGFVHVNSDGGLSGPLPQNHVSRLTTSAIDCSGKSVVFIEFQSHIGTYVEPIETNAILRVSTNGTTWTNFTPFPGLTDQNYFSANPYYSVLDISSVAANQATVYIQWQWTANWEYMWDLDDIVLYDANPTPRNDLSISDSYFSPSSMVTPVSQIATDTFDFFVLLSNVGSEDQTNVVVKAWVTTDTDEEIYADSITLPVLASGVVDSFVLLDGRFAPELPAGEYRIKYSVRADSADSRMIDNSTNSRFFVNQNNIFSKEVGSSITSTSPLNPSDWYAAALYQMSSGSMDNYQVSQVQFSFATDPAELPVTDVEATVFLFRVNDDVLPNYDNFDGSDFFSPSLEWVAVGPYEAPDTMQNFMLQSVQMLDATTAAPFVPLDNGARYIVAIGYAGNSNVTRHVFDTEANTNFPYKVSSLVYTDRWYLAGFQDLNTVARMALSLVTTTDNKPLPETTMKLFPNPIRETLNLGLNFDQPTKATITIADLTGRVIRLEDRENLTNDILTYQLPELATGTYLARIATEEGTLTKKFVVQK